MSPALSTFAEKVAAVERHLARVSGHLPASPGALVPSSLELDAVLLHLWQAAQITIDVAMSVVVRLHLGTPRTYAEAFRALEAAGLLERGLADRLVRMVGFRNRVAHAYEDLDLARVHAAASEGPADLRAFLAVVRDLYATGQLT